MITQEQQDEFLAFRDSCIWLRNCYNTFNHLFDSDEETEARLRKIAPIFFSDLNSIMLEYFFLQVRRITDNKSSCGRENLSIQNMHQGLEKKKLLTEEIKELYDQIISYRKIISSVSNRIVAHADKKTYMQSTLLGVHTKQELESFIDSIQAYTDAVGIVLGVGPLDYSVQAGEGDVIDFLTALRSIKGA